MKKEIIILMILLFSVTFVPADNHTANTNVSVDSNINPISIKADLNAEIKNNDGDTNDSNKNMNNSNKNKIGKELGKSKIVPYVAKELNQIKKEYQKKFVKAVQDGNQELKKELKQIRKSIAKQIGKTIQKSKDLNYEQYENFKQKLRIDYNSITIEDNETKDKNKIQARAKISVRVKNKLLEIRNTNNRIEIVDGNVSVETEEEIEIDENGLSVRNKRLKVLPEQIQSKIQQKIKLKLESNDKNMVHYQADVNNTRNLFGIIPIQAKEKIRINAETGKIESYERPWWSFLALGKDIINEDIEE